MNLTKLKLLTLLFVFNFTANSKPLFFRPVPLEGKANFSGIITDSITHLPVQGVYIFLNDIKIGTVSDADGKFELKNLPEGKHIIEVSHIGYTTIVDYINISGHLVKNYALSLAIIENNAVIVTGVSGAAQLKRLPFQVSVIRREDITQNISTNIIDAIAKVPGVSALTTGPNVSKPFIRGLGYNRILTLYDGVRQEGQQWGDEHGIEVDQFGIDRIEVIKGPASLTYGSDALAGVVNLIPTQPAPVGKTMGEINTEHQTNNGMFGASGMLKSTYQNGFEWIARVSHKEATNYQNKIDGRVYNTAFKETDASAFLGMHGSWGYSHLTFTLFDDLQEIPDGSRDSLGRFTKQTTVVDTLPRPVVSNSELKSYAMTPLHQHVQHYRINSSNSFQIGDDKLAVNIGFQQSVRREFDNPEIPYQNVAGLFLQLGTYSYDVKYFLHEIKGWNLTVGANGMYQINVATKGTDFIIPNYHQFDVGPFAMIKKTFDKLDISGGIRYDSRYFRNSELYTTHNSTTGFDTPVYGADTVGANRNFYNSSRSFSGFSGSLGATYNFSDKFAVKMNLSRGYRAPNILEISANGVHPGTNLYQLGNNDFKPEFSFQEDIGLTYNTKNLALGFSLFNNNVSNYIYNQRLLSAHGGDSIIVAGTPTYKFVQSKAQLYGGEFSLDIHPVKALHFENSISAVYALNKGIDSKLISDSNKYLPLIPPVHGLSELKYDFKFKKDHIVNAFVKVQLVYYAAQNRVYLTDNTETSTAGYHLFNAGFGGGITNKKGNTVMNIYLMGNNLFNVAYFDHLSRLKYFYYNSNDTNPAHGIHNMGRNFSVKIDIPLSFKN